VQHLFIGLAGAMVTAGFYECVNFAPALAIFDYSFARRFISNFFIASILFKSNFINLFVVKAEERCLTGRFVLQSAFKSAKTEQIKRSNFKCF
jgi:hypothetical protein